MSNNFEMVRETRNIAMNHDYETGLAQNLCETPPSGDNGRHHDDAIYPACNAISLSRKPRIADKTYYGSLSWSLARFFRIRHKNFAKRLLAGKSRWRHIRFAMKPRCLGNHTSQIKSYYSTLSWNLGRLVIFIKTANSLLILKNLSVYKCC